MVVHENLRNFATDNQQRPKNHEEIDENAIDDACADSRRKPHELW